MGIYVNPGNANFLRDLNSVIYVDKSMLIAEVNRFVNTNGNYICVSRARRFGKSMAANMLAAYFSKGCDSRELFAKLKIAGHPGFDKYLNKLNVIKFDVNGFYSRYGIGVDIVEKFTSEIRAELKQAFPKAKIKKDDPLPDAILRVYAIYGEQFVIIMDEYDVLTRENAPDEVTNTYFQFLNGMFKNADVAPAIALAYLTGILPIVRDNVQSKLNLFDEYTMLNSLQLAEFVGFTEDEARTLCEEHGMSFDECRRWYDGYRVNGRDIYCPRSVVMAMRTQEFGGYWVKTGSFESLNDFLQMDFHGVKSDVMTMLGGGSVDVNVTTYLNSMKCFATKDDMLTYLIHIGYLAYDSTNGRCRIPNSEIAGEWVNAIGREKDYEAAFELVASSKRLVDSVLEMDAVAVESALEHAHEEICSNLNYNNEGTFQAVICLAFFYAKQKYTMIKECPTGKGYADVVLLPYVPNVPAMIIELKRNQNAGAALEQITEKRYFGLLEKYQGDLLLVGVNYDDKTKKHTCEIQRFVK